MTGAQRYDACDTFLTALCRKDVIAAAIQYYRLPSDERAVLWDPLDHGGLPMWDLPPWVELEPVRAALAAYDRGDELGVRRAYRTASRLTRPVIDRVLRELRG